MFQIAYHRRSVSLRTIAWGASVTLALAANGTVTAQPAATQAARASGPAGAQAQPAVAVLTREKVDALLATPDKVVFLDVRRPDELAAIGGLPVYLNIQLSELDRFLGYIPRDRGVVTVSNHAGRAQKAASLLVKSGFNVIGAVGAENYAEQGGALYGRKFVTPLIAGVVPADTRIEVVREGFEGTEGPIALADGSILFTENRADRIVKIDPSGAVSTYLEKTGSANALALSAKGDLLAVQTAAATPGVAVLRPKPKVLAASFGGKPLIRPNDLALARAGDVYFSDPGAAQAPGSAPRAGNAAATGAAPAKTGLYWLDRRSRVHLIADDIRRPNGVALSPDERTLYVADTGGEHLLAYTVGADGAVSGRRDFAKLAGFSETPNPSSGADGITVDADGRIYVATNAGVEVFSAEGTALGIIALPKKPQNLAFGGPDRSKLYVVGRGSVYRIATKTRGVDRPGK